MEKEYWSVVINNLDYSLNSNVFIYRIIGDLIQWLEIKTPDVILHSEKRSVGEEQVKPTFVNHLADMRKLVFKNE